MTTKRKMTLVATAVATLLTVGCSDSSREVTTTTTVTTTVTTDNPTNPISTSRTFSLPNTDAASTFELVTSSVGSSDSDTSLSSGTVALGSATVSARQAASATSDASPNSVASRHAVLHRGLARSSTRNRAVEKSVVGYDTLPTLSFYISQTNRTVTLFNRTPGVGSNTGTKPTTIITYVEQVSGVDVISTADLQKAIAAWETTNPFGPAGNTGIYNQVHAVFGQEWNSGGGNDSDPRVVVCFLSTATMGSDGLFGYVDLADELANRGQSIGGSQSNGGEILYLHAQPSSVSNFFQGDGFDGYATMAHELEHLTIFNNKYAQQGTFPSNASEDSPSVDEGLATLAEEDCGFSLTATGGGNSFIFDVIKAYEQGRHGVSSFFTFNEGGDYGKAYLFFKYIQDTAGLSAITAISTSTQTGSANIATQVGRSFADQQQRWALANYVSGFASGGAPYRYNSLNLTGTYSLHNNNDSSSPVSGTLPGIVSEQTLAQSSSTTQNLIAFSQYYLNLGAGTGTTTATVANPSNFETSLVQVKNGVVTNVTF